MGYDCAETFRRLQDFLDRELSSEEIAEVQAHLQRCGMCAEEYVFEEAILRHTRNELDKCPVPEDLEARVSLALDLISKKVD